MRIHIETFGCPTNVADSEAIAGCLLKAGFELTQYASAADIILFNTCAVKGPTENRIINTIKHTPKNKKIIVAGCLPLINLKRLQMETRFNALVGPAAAPQIADILKRVIDGEKIIALENTLRAKPPLNLPSQKTNPIIGIIPINYGCLGHCAYCCVIFARGNLRSYKPAEIAERVRSDLAVGVKEFWLTSQDTACYGKDMETNLAALLNTLSSIEGDFKIRVGMMNPNNTKSFQSELLEAFKSEKIFKFVHLPVQSGDSEVLLKMQRYYTTQEFKATVNLFRTAFPQITLATDVICGFPGETGAAFKNTLNLIEELKPDIVNISKFFARPNTLAAEMHKEFVNPEEIKQRSTTAAHLVKRIALERNQRWMGWKGKVLVDEKGKTCNSWISRNFCYKPIVIKTSASLFGKEVNVQVEKAFPTYLVGKIF